jgi:hypothetical protein
VNNTQKPDVSSLGPTDAVLNCPGCMVLVCHDCQRYLKNLFILFFSYILFFLHRHETNRNQYRAMFVFNCTIDENRTAPVPKSNSQKSSKQKKNNSNKRFKTDESTSLNNEEEQESNDDILRPVLCSECGTELGVYEPKEELYHFANVLASH